MNSWRIKSDPRPEPPGGPKTRYVVFKDAGITPLWHLDNRDAEELTDALIRELGAPGYEAADPGAVPAPSVSVRLKGDRVVVVTPERSTNLSKAEASALLTTLAERLGRQPE